MQEQLLSLVNQQQIHRRIPFPFSVELVKEVFQLHLQSLVPFRAADLDGRPYLLLCADGGVLVDRHLVELRH